MFYRSSIVLFRSSISIFIDISIIISSDRSLWILKLDFSAYWMFSKFIQIYVQTWFPIRQLPYFHPVPCFQIAPYTFPHACSTSPFKNIYKSTLHHFSFVLIFQFLLMIPVISSLTELKIMKSMQALLFFLTPWSV